MPSSIKTDQIRFRALLRHLPLLLPFAFMVWNGFAGVDFGHHWDEPFMLHSVTSSAARQVWLPTFYNYPSGAYWVSMAGTLPEVIAAGGITDRAAYFSALAQDSDYLLRLRRIFVVMTALSLVWLYAAAYVLSGRRWVALLAAGLFATSWELNYHARWIAPDNLVWHTASLTLMFAIFAFSRPQQKRWLWLTAAAAGLVIGSKYSVGLIVIYVILTAYFTWRAQAAAPPSRLIMLLCSAGLVTVGVYLLTTPGTLLDTNAFIRDVQYEINHYRTGHENHTVAAGWEHLRLNLTYLGWVLFSPNGWVSLSWVLLALAGAVVLWRRSARLGLLVLAFPVVYLLYISTQQVMIIRNLIVLYPTLCLLAALGAAFIWGRVPSPVRRWALAGVMLACIGFSIMWNIQATRSINQRQDMALFMEQAHRYMTEQASTRFCVSGPLRYWMEDVFGLPLPQNAHMQGEGADYWLFLASDVGTSTLPANRTDLTAGWFGTYEVNYHYYPSWWGDDRVILMDAGRAAAYNAPVDNCM